jgi:hypothetical protein
MHDLEGSKNRTLHKNSEECGTHKFNPHPKIKPHPSELEQSAALPESSGPGWIFGSGPVSDNPVSQGLFALSGITCANSRAFKLVSINWQR